MRRYIAIFNDMFDDLEINGFVVMSEKEVESFEETAASITWPFNQTIGDIELMFNSGDELLEKVEFKELLDNDSRTIRRLFNNEFGFFINETMLREVIGSEDNDDYSDDEEDDENFDY